LVAGASASADGANASLEASAGNGTDKNGGNVLLKPGVPTGTGTQGTVVVQPASGDAIVLANSADLYIGGGPASSAANGARIVQKVASTITTTGSTLDNGSFARIDSDGEPA
jgi:hypothetical protein